jgi:hypothetical protein
MNGKPLPRWAALGFLGWAGGVLSCFPQPRVPEAARLSPASSEEILLLAELRRVSTRSDVTFSVIDSQVMFTRRASTVRPNVVMTWALYLPTEVPHARVGAVTASHANEAPHVVRDVSDWHRVAPQWKPSDAGTALRACRELLAIVAPPRGYPHPPRVPSKSSELTEEATDKPIAVSPLAPPRNLSDSTQFQWLIWTPQPRGDYLFNCIFSRARGRSVPMITRQDSILRG